MAVPLQPSEPVPSSASTISIGRAAGITALFLVFQMGIGAGIRAISTVIGALNSTTDSADLPFVWQIVIGNSLATLCLFNWEARRQKSPWRSWPPARVSLAWLLFPVLLAVFGNLILVELPSRFVNDLIPPPAAMEAAMLQLFDLVKHPIAIPIALVVVAPITEETVFRGHMLSGLLRTIPPHKAILTSAALFSLLHLNPWQMPATFMIGLVLGWIYYRTGSVLLCILGHALHNGIALLYTANILNTVGTENAPPFPFWIHLLALGGLTLGVSLILRLTPRPPLQVPPPLPA